MDRKDKIKIFSSVMVMIGAAIGAGFLAIPYGISKVGLSIGIVQLVVVASATAFMCAYVAELIFRIRKQHQVVGLVGKSLGKGGMFLMTIFMLVGIYGALSAYSVGVSSLAQSLFGTGYGINLLILYLMGGSIIFFGLNAVDKTEVFSVSLLIPLLILSSVFLFKDVLVENLVYTNVSNFFYPFGILFFACFAYQSIPEINKITGGKNIPKIIILGTLSFVLLYSFFSFAFVGAFGEGISEFAVDSLYGFPAVIGTIVAILAMFTSFIILALVIKDTYIEDYGLQRTVSTLLTVLPPFLFAFLKPSFVNVVGFTGAVTGGGVGILLVLAVYKIRKKQEKEPKPSFVVPGGNTTLIITTIIFTLGVISEVLKYV